MNNPVFRIYLSDDKYFLFVDTMKTIRWRDIGAGGDCRATSGRLCGPDAFPLHRHDFPEVFWVTHGSGTHRINGEERPLHAGVLVLMRPADAHGFSSDSAGILVENVAIRPGVLDGVRRRYFLNDDKFWNRPDARVPEHYELVPDQLQQMKAAFQQLSFGPQQSFHAGRFLMNLLHLVHFEPSSVDARRRAAHPGLPDWLANALAIWPEARHFADGTAALARLAGRSPEHVARVMRACTGRTPTEWLNEERMNHAAKQLEVTDRKVLDIAMDCGFDSLGHFYSVFQREHGCPPRAYRMRFQPRPI